VSRFLRFFPLLFVFGCGGSDLAIVSGTVLVDDKPVANGTIAFVPANGIGEPASVAIKNGQYELRTEPGPKFIQITVPVVTGHRKAYEGPGAPTIEVTEETIPERFNLNTELKMDVESGKNKKDWSIAGKAKK